MSSELLPVGYEDFLLSIKERVRSAQLRAMLVVNIETLLHERYAFIGEAAVVPL